MKTLVLSTAIALGLAAPSFANDQLAAALGVDAGQYSTAQLIAADRALQDDDRDLARHILSGGGSVFGLSDAGAEFAAIQAEQDEDGPVGRFNNSTGTEVISTQSFGSAATDAGRAFAIEQAREQENWPLVRLLESGGSLGGARGLF